LILVVAANREGYERFCGHYGLIGKSRFISDVDQLRGYENRIVLMAPGWWLGRGGSSFANSLDDQNIRYQSIKSYFPRLKFLEAL
jgi:hypothetical protein